MLFPSLRVHDTIDDTSSPPSFGKATYISNPKISTAMVLLIRTNEMIDRQLGAYVLQPV